MGHLTQPPAEAGCPTAGCTGPRPVAAELKTWRRKRAGSARKQFYLLRRKKKTCHFLSVDVNAAVAKSPSPGCLLPLFGLVQILVALAQYFLLRVLSYVNSNGQYLKELLEIFCPCVLVFWYSTFIDIVFAACICDEKHKKHSSFNLKATVHCGGAWRYSRTAKGCRRGLRGTEVKRDPTRETRVTQREKMKC